MEVKELQKTDRELWDAAISRLRVAHHAFAWPWREVISRSFGHQPRYLYCSAGEDIGVFPLYVFSSKLFGKALISIPYLNAGGIRASSPEITEALLAHANRIAREERVSYMELRHAKAQELQSGIDATRTHKITMTLELPSDAEELFASFPPKLRSQIRRPTKSGLYAESVFGAEVGVRHIEDFYAVFSEHMRDLGTPVYPKSLFRNSLRSFGERSRVVLVYSERKPVAAGITIGFATRVEILWASSLLRFNKVSPNMLLYWEALKAACSDGYTRFDFGRSTRDSGTYRFKKQWGAEPEELSWQYQLMQGTLPDVNPASPKFKALVSCWKRLPLPVANLFGPYLTRGIP